jgi:peptidyl-prolyl cis-trans isomerase D
MFEFIRSHQRLMQVILLVLILPSFALIGVSGYTTYVSGNHDLVKVGGHAITLQDFDQARRNQLQELQSQNQAGFDPASLDNEPARKALLESLIDRSVIATVASKDRFSVSDTVLREAIASIPQLQVNGQFSAERYRDLLKSMGMTSRDFERGQRGELALGRVLGPVDTTATVPQPVVGSIERALTAQRTVRLRIYPMSAYEKNVNVSDADIKAWYDANKEQLKLPEQADIQYLLLNEAAAMKNVPPVSADAMKKYYEQNKSRFVSPARVNLSHILVSVPVGATPSQRDAALKEANKIDGEVQANKANFAEIARKQSQDAGTAHQGGELGWITQGTWPAKLDSAVFALKKGEVSGVIDGPGGYHIFKANDVDPSRTQTLDEAKPQLEKEIRQQLGADKFADMSTKLTSLVYDNAGSLQPAADALGLQVKTASGIARDRLLDAGEVGPGAAAASPDAKVLGDVRVRRAVFMPRVLTDKQNSAVIEITPDTLIVVRVAKSVAAHVPPLDKVTGTIRQTLVQEKALAGAVKDGEAALAQDRKAADPAKVPDGFGSPMTISRIDPQGLSKEVLDAALAADVKTLPAYTGMKAPTAYVVLRIEQAQPGKSEDSRLAGLPAQLDQLWGNTEKAAVLKALREEVKVKMQPEAKKALAGEVENQDG